MYNATRLSHLLNMLDNDDITQEDTWFLWLKKSSKMDRYSAGFGGLDRPG